MMRGMADSTTRKPRKAAPKAAKSGKGRSGDSAEGYIDEDGIVLYGTGWARITIAGPDGAATYRLRRPLFGELRRLRVALQGVQDTLAEAAANLAGEQVRLNQLAAAAADEAQEPPDDDEFTELRDTIRAASRRLLDDSDDLRLHWWQQVFDLLGVDGTPDEDEWPGWVADPQMPAKIMEHWRSAPLARGA